VEDLLTHILEAEDILLGTEVLLQEDIQEEILLQAEVLRQEGIQGEVQDLEGNIFHPLKI